MLASARYRPTVRFANRQESPVALEGTVENLLRAKFSDDGSKVVGEILDIHGSFLVFIAKLCQNIAASGYEMLFVPLSSL